MEDLQGQAAMACCSFLHCPSAASYRKDQDKNLLVDQVQEEAVLHNGLEAIIHVEAYAAACRHQAVVPEVEVHLEYLQVLQIHQYELALLAAINQVPNTWITKDYSYYCQNSANEPFRLVYFVVGAKEYPGGVVIGVAYSSSAERGTWLLDMRT